MLIYKGTFEFDIGAGYGERMYDFFTVDGEEDFSGFVKYYEALWDRFDYSLDGRTITEDNKKLSPAVKSAMKEHDANLCLTFLEEDDLGDGVKVRTMVVNREVSEGIYDTISFHFFYFANNAQSYFAKGLAYQKTGYYHAAVMYYTCAIKFDPNKAELYRLRGGAFTLKKDYDYAIKDFTRAIKIAPNDEDAYNQRGYAYAMKGDFEMAITDFSQAIQLKPDYALAYINRGSMYKEKGDYNSAKNDYTKALEIDPNNKTAREMLEELGVS